MKKLETPKSEAELAEIVKHAYAKNIKLEIKGGGTRPIGNPVIADKVLSTSKLSNISLYEPGALTIVASAGATLEQVKKLLAKEGQHLPFEPTDFTKLLKTKGSPTIGSVVTTANSGPRRIQVGAARDALIGVRFVNGEGDIIKNGGRVMKNVTGYDLVKLMAGSYGTLGVLTEVSFKILPKPETAACILIHGLNEPAAISVLAKALGSPFDISGAAHTPAGLDGKPVTMIRIEGFEKSVAYRAEQLKILIAPLLPADAEIVLETKAANIAAGWKWVSDVEPFAEKQGAVWKLSVKPSDGPKLVEKVSNQIDCKALYDWGGGLIWLLVPDAEFASESLIREIVGSFNGHATLIRASEDVRSQVEAFQPEHSTIQNLSEKLRLQLDPKGILNPGKMLRRSV